MSPLLRSLLSLYFGGILLIADSLCAETPPPLPRLPRPDTEKTQLKGLGDIFSGSRATHPQADPAETSIQAAHQDERSVEQISAPKPVTQASFSPPPTAAMSQALAEESYDEKQPEKSFDEEHEFNAMLDKPLFSKKTAKKNGGTAEDETFKLSGWTNKLVKPELTPVLSVGGSLLIVIAAFFLLVILFRKVTPQGNRPLPKEAFECLGKYSLTQKHHLQVLRLGNRIVLVSVMPEGVTTLAEITDPDEAVQFLGLCRRLDGNSATEVFRKAVANMSDDELSQPHHRPVVTSRRNAQPAASLDLYSDPDESLASILARGRHYGR
jgi:flagellar biogenesis protein FliO